MNRTALERQDSALDFYGTSAATGAKDVAFGARTPGTEAPTKGAGVRAVPGGRPHRRGSPAATPLPSAAPVETLDQRVYRSGADVGRRLPTPARGRATSASHAPQPARPTPPTPSLIDALMTVGRPPHHREAGLRLPALGQERPFLERIEAHIFPQLVEDGVADCAPAPARRPSHRPAHPAEGTHACAAAPSAKEALCLLRDELTALEMARDYTGMVAPLDALQQLQGDPTHAQIVRTIRCELLLYLRRRRSVVAAGYRPRTQPGLTPLEAVEHRLVAELVTPAG